MKYMTFRSSCSYAGLANLLSFYGIDTEDRDIAFQMHLPYLFSREDGAYLSGTMLQGAKWFNLYLNPLGFTLSERRLGREEVCSCTCFPAMLGLRVSAESKHAVILTDRKDGNYTFLNNKRADSPEPEVMNLTEADLISRLDESVVVGHLKRVTPSATDYRSCLKESIQVLRSLWNEINTFCRREESAASLEEAMNRLFRPILLEGITMLELLGETEIIVSLREVQRHFLGAVRGSRPVVLEKELDMPRLNAAIAQYEKLIIKHMETK